MHALVRILVLSLLCAGAWGGYQLTSLTSTAYGYQGALTMVNAGPYGNDITNLALQVWYQSSSMLRIKIYDPKNQRWEVPFVNLLDAPEFAPSTLDYNITFNNNPFGFTVTRASDGDVLLNTISSLFNPMIYEDQYIELSTVLPTNPNIYGLGERMTSFRLPLNTQYIIWNRDQGTPVISNLYGTHPFYLEMRNTGNAHGVYYLNSNAQEFDLQENYMTYKTIGGILDIFVFLGPTPASVVQQYHTVIGNTHFPPYWSLGWHQCRWGYNTINDTANVVGNYSYYGIPLDTMWNDIDYMDSYRDFTNDPVRYPPSQVRAFVESLHEKGMHYMMIVDPGIMVYSGYPSYEELLESGAYIREYGTDTPLQGKVWPGLVNFPDFFHPNASDYWYDQVSTFHATGPEFDGMWIDMNEISNFCTAQCVSLSEEKYKPSQGKPKIAPEVRDINGINYENPPYVPGGTPLETSTINTTAQQYINIQYNIHNMYGWSEGWASKIALEKLRGKRSVVISRSTHAGSGSHNGHWLGDNNSDFIDLYYSIPGILSMQLFGVTQVGADICGFGGDTTEELCARWMQLGALYPFARNHNSIGSRSQEPYAFGQPLINISINALERRYTLLPYLYTLFAAAHYAGETVWRPLFFEFPTDTNTFGIDQQFMIGPFLLVTPVLTQNATSVVGYFPQDIFYSYYDGTLLKGSGENVTLAAPLDFIPIHVRGGAVIPTQTPALTTTVARTLPFSLLVALDTTGSAWGELYLDDGETLANDTFSFVNFIVGPVAMGGMIASYVDVNNYNGTVPPLNTVTVYGVQHGPSKVVANNNAANFTYNPTTSVLTIINLGLDIVSNFDIVWA